MTRFTYVELFAGAGGLSYGLDQAGWTCAAHCERDPFVAEVLRQRWPEVPVFGDVSTLTGQQILEATGGEVPLLLSGGSPCQDLSLAGRRAGMTKGSGTRSSLYFEQVRIWNELGSQYFLWENVLGALSSGKPKGGDFAVVLSAIVGSPVTVPRDGWGTGGGVVCGDSGVCAWRVLDARYFGFGDRTLAQRRRRVFVLGTRAGGVDPAEVLSLCEGLSRYPRAKPAAREGTAPSARGGAQPGDREGIRREVTAEAVGIDLYNQSTREDEAISCRTSGEGVPHVMMGIIDKQSGAAADEDLAPPLKTDMAHQMGPVVMAVRTANTNAHGLGVSEEISHTLDSANGQMVIPLLEVSKRQGKSLEGSAGIGDVGDPMFTLQAGAQHGVMAFDCKRGNDPDGSDVAPTLRAQNSTGGKQPGGGHIAVVAFDTTQITSPTNRSNPQDDDPCHSLSADADAPLVVTFTQGFLNRGHGPRPMVDMCQTLGADTTGDQQPLVFDTRGNGDGATVSTLAGDHSNRVTDYTPVVIDRAGTDQGTNAKFAPSIERSDLMPPLVAKGPHSVQTFGAGAIGDVRETDIAGTITSHTGAGPGETQNPAYAMDSVIGHPRRLTPRECERLMGWPDDWTLIAKASDTKRYKATGNGVASPVAAWIGSQLKAHIAFLGLHPEGV